MKDREMNGFLDRGTVFKGDLTFDDMLRIDGQFEGTIHSQSTLIVGDGAEITGEIQVDTITVNGQVDGVIRAAERVEINKNARVKGEIHTPVLSIQEGAAFDGSIFMTADTRNTSRPAAKTPKKKEATE